ncbi:hypothetical protein ABZ608_18585 [Streptomyces sp. NPDC013172]|uniref:hypothetical protein n=1 Tax=Streptomyces sp. NPDC013172 TaxID=3155009 RepID=UPI0033D7B65C
MNATFEDRLLDELKGEVVRRAAEAVPVAGVPRRVVTPRRVGVALAACGAAAAFAVVLPGSGTTAAYAVETHPDGTVTFTLQDVALSGPQQRDLVRKLTDAGVYAQVNRVPKGMRCAEPGDLRPGDQIVAVDLGPGAPAGAGNGAMEWHRTLHRGDTVRIENAPQHAVVYTFIRGKASPCRLEPIG